MSSIELRKVGYAYKIGGVSEVSFTVPESKIACMLGPSGSGKTTLMKLIAGFLPPHRGSIWLSGVCVAGDGIFVPPQKRGVGMVFQQHALFPHMSVAKNILYGCTKVSREERQAVLEKLLADFHISQHINRYPHQISGGEQQRVALARALAAEPKVLLMDEPFASLDQALRHSMQEQCLKIIGERRLTTIIVTHDEEDAERLGDMLIRLKSGGGISLSHSNIVSAA